MLIMYIYSAEPNSNSPYCSRNLVLDDFDALPNSKSKLAKIRNRILKTLLRYPCGSFNATFVQNQLETYGSL